MCEEAEPQLIFDASKRHLRSKGNAETVKCIGEIKLNNSNLIQKTPNVNAYSPDEALALIVQTGLTRNAYQNRE